MKILIAYDGSGQAEAALDDLQRAGLPAEAEALVISVAEIWLPPEIPDEKEIVEMARDARSAAELEKRYAKNSQVVREHRELARQAEKRLKINFPKWEISAEATYGSAAWEILRRAETFKPDLILVGSHGRTAFGRLFLGSISQKVLTEAHCSVRIGRGRIELEPAPHRILVGFDGSPGAEIAVESLAERRFKEPCEVRLVAATDVLVPTPIGHFFPAVEEWVVEDAVAERRYVEQLAEAALQKLRAAGFKATFHLHTGNPKHVLVEEADRWKADCIFVGANAYGSRLEKLLLGSVSAAVAARAHCSVEVVRKIKA